MANRIQLRRDTSANWATINPILADGEPGLEIDTNKIKYGDGTHGWVSLSYSGSSDPTRLVNGSYSVTLTSDGYVLFPNYRFPAADGTSNQVLQTNGSGVVSWGTINTTTDQLVNGSYTVALNSSGLLTVPSIIDSTAGTGAVTINSNDGATTRTWTFGTGGDLTLPQTGSGAASITSGVNGLSITANSHTWEFAPSGSLVVPGAIQSTNGIVISNAGVVGATAGIVLPANAGTGAVQIGNTYGPIQLGSAAGGGTELNWTFGTDGILILPQTGSGAASITSGTNGLTIVANSHTWEFAPTNSLVLPSGGTVTESTSPSGVGNTITFTPFGGTDGNQKLLVYPGGGGEGNHLHLTTGALGTTSLFLGNDAQYIRTRTDGAMVIGTGDTNPETPGYGHRWVFGPDGAVTLPANTFHTNNNLTVQTSGIPASVSGVNYSSGSWDANQGTNISTTGGTGSGLTVDVTADVSGYVGSVTIHTPGNGYSDGDVISASNGSSSVQFSIHILSAKSWTFGADGTLTFPDASVQTSAYQYKTIMSAFGASGPNIQIDNAQFSYNNAGNPTVAAVSGTWSGPWTAEATVYNGTSFVTTTYGSTSATWTSVAAYGIGITFGNAGDKAVAYFTDDTNGHIYKVTWIASSTNPTTNCTTIVEKLI